VHLRGGVHGPHAEGEHLTQGGDARRPVQAHLHGAADGRDEKINGLQNQRGILHHHGALPQRRKAVICIISSKNGQGG
jgi:hypothetical protein